MPGLPLFLFSYSPRQKDAAHYGKCFFSRGTFFSHAAGGHRRARPLARRFARTTRPPCAPLGHSASVVRRARALVVVLVNSMSVTYFIGTGRWCREVVETYALDASYVERSQQLKRSTFPFAILGIFGVVFIVALGGAADPATGRPGTQDWVTPHLIGSLLIVAGIAWCFQSQLPNIRRQHVLIEDIMSDVRTARLGRGLEIENSA